MLLELTTSQNKALQHFCELHKVKRLAFFGSVLGSRFSSQSDIDVLIEFHEGEMPGYAFFSLPSELEAILGRSVDLSTVEGLHPFIRDNVLSSAETYYYAS